MGKYGIIRNIMNIEAIGEMVAARRKMLSVSQMDLARLCGISVHALSNLEGGKGNPTIALLLKVLDVLGLKLTIGV